MKPAIYYTLVSRWHGFDIMAVTSENRNMVYGRREYKAQTRAAIRDCAGKFSTEELAKSCVDALVEDRERYRMLKLPHVRAIRDLDCQEIASRDAIIKRATP